MEKEEEDIREGLPPNPLFARTLISFVLSFHTRTKVQSFCLQRWMYSSLLSVIVSLTPDQRTGMPSIPRRQAGGGSGSSRYTKGLSGSVALHIYFGVDKMSDYKQGAK